MFAPSELDMLGLAAGLPSTRGDKKKQIRARVSVLLGYMHFKSYFLLISFGIETFPWNWGV